MTENRFITDSQDLGVILRKAVFEMPDSPSVRIDESDTGAWRMTGAGVYFEAELFPGHVKITKHKVSPEDFAKYEKRLKSVAGQNSAVYEGGNLVVHSTNNLDDVYNAMAAIFMAGKPEDSPQRRESGYKKIEDIFS